MDNTREVSDNRIISKVLTRSPDLVEPTFNCGETKMYKNNPHTTKALWNKIINGIISVTEAELHRSVSLLLI